MALGVGGAAPDAVQSSCRIASAIGVNVNSANTDTALVFDPHTSGRYFVVDYIVVTNPSVSLTTATGGVFSAAAAGGTALMANIALAPLVNPHDFMQTGFAAASTVTGAITKNSTALNTTLFFRNGTAQGAPATVDVFVFGRLLPE